MKHFRIEFDCECGEHVLLKHSEFASPIRFTCAKCNRIYRLQEEKPARILSADEIREMYS